SPHCSRGMGSRCARCGAAPIVASTRPRAGGSCCWRSGRKGRSPGPARPMLGSDRLRALLADLARTRRAPGGQGAGAFLPGAAEPEASPATGSTLAGTGTADAPGHFPPWKVSEPVGIEAFLPGGEWRNGRGAVYVHERLRSEVERPELHWGRLDTPSEDEEELHALAAGGLTRALFLDLETGGLASSPVFLAGT